MPDILGQQDLEEYSPVLVKLLQGVMYCEDKLWESLMRHRLPVADYFLKIGLDLVIFEGDGFAYLKQKNIDPDAVNPASLPRLVRRVPLSYEVTLLCVLLRDRLHQFDVESGDQTRLILTRDQIRELVVLFFKEKANEVKLFRNIDVVIQRTVELGFLRQLNVSHHEEYEVMRILKARFTVEILESLKTKLSAYAELPEESGERRIKENE